MIQLLTLFCSLMIQFAAVDYPIDYTQTCAEFYSLYTTVWENVVSRGYAVNPDLGILVDRNGSDPNGSSSLAFYTPAEPFNNTQSSVSVSLRDDTTVSLNCVNWYRWLVNADGSIASGPTVSNISKAGYYLDGVYTWGNHNTIIYNSYYDLSYGNTSTFNWQTEQPLPVSPGIGSMGSGGHSMNNDPFEEMENGNYNWHGISGSLSAHGHSVNLPTTTPTYDFTDPDQSLLGQILNNTSDILGHSSVIYEGLKNINDNLIIGASAVYNGVSASIINVNSFLAYVSAPYDSDLIIDYLEDSDFYSYRTDFQSYIDDFNGNVDIIKSGILSTETQELVIPIDFHQWLIITEDYGTISPYNATHYMRFPFLDETKALWQPLLIAFLYLSLIIGLFFDSPAIVRGVMNT